MPTTPTNMTGSKIVLHVETQAYQSGRFGLHIVHVVEQPASLTAAGYTATNGVKLKASAVTEFTQDSGGNAVVYLAGYSGCNPFILDATQLTKLEAAVKEFNATLQPPSPPASKLASHVRVIQ